MNLLDATLHGLFWASNPLMLWHGILTVNHYADANYDLGELMTFISHTPRALYLPSLLSPSISPSFTLLG